MLTYLRFISCMLSLSVLAGCQSRLFSFERNDYANKPDVCVAWPKTMKPRATHYLIDPYKAVHKVANQDDLITPKT
jgi:hypothetical protein